MTNDAHGPSMHVEKGERSDVLVLAFSGFAGKLMMHPFEFFQLSGLFKYSRILLRDDFQCCYMAGLDAAVPDFESLRDTLKEQIALLAPKRIIALGTSGGGTAALLLGHELKADYVHAFAPYTYLDLPNVIRRLDTDIVLDRGRTLLKINMLPRSAHAFFDLRRVLLESNGKSRYYVHVCRDHNWDSARARHLEGCPGVKILSHACGTHAVAHFLARRKRLHGLLDIDAQDGLAAEE